MSRFPIIRRLARSAYAMASRCFGASRETIVEECQKAKLVWGKELYARLGPRVQANADLDSLAPRFAVEAREAIREHLGILFAPEPTPAFRKPKQVAWTHGFSTPCVRRCPVQCL